MGKTITTYLINESQYGPKTIEIRNWVGKAIYSPISNLSDLLNTRNEFKNPGIYFLKSQPDNEIYSEKIYVGQTENIKQRLSDHLLDENRDFDECLVFISKDDMLTRSHIKYIEARSIKYIKELNNAELENKKEEKIPALPETDISDMEYFFNEMKVIMPIVSFNCFKPNTMHISQVNDTIDINKIIDQDKIFYIKSRNNIYAKAIETEDGFIVLKNSKCRKKDNPSMKNEKKVLKKKLIETKILVDKGDTFVFSEDTIFKSPSQASSVILGSQTSGPQNWKTEDNKTYKDFMENKLNMGKLKYSN